MIDDKNEFDESPLDKIEDLIERRSSAWDRDKTDIATARSVSSGFAFDEDDKAYQGELKAEVAVNLVRSWISQVVATYDSSPFSVAVKSVRAGVDAAPWNDVMSEILAHNDIHDLASKSLRLTANEGVRYWLVESEVIDSSLNLQIPKIRLVDPKSVVIASCKEDDMRDCPEAMIVETIRKSDAKQRYGMTKQDFNRKGLSITAGIDLDVASDECITVLYMEKVEEGVQITKIVHDQIVEQATLPLSVLPLTRNVGEEVWIDDVQHHRGAYYFVQDLLKTINFMASETQSRSASGTPANYLMDTKSLSGVEGDYTQGADVLVQRYNSWDGEKELPAPIPISKQLFLAELLQGIDAFKGWVRDVLGSASAEPIKGESAEGVLTRRQFTEAVANQYLKALQVTLKAVTNILIDYSVILFDTARKATATGAQLAPLGLADGIEPVIDKGPLAASRKREVVGQLLALKSIDSSPDAGAKLMPAIIASMDLDPTLAAYLQSVYPVNVGQPQQLPPEVQQALMAKDQQAQQMQQVIDEQNKSISALQIQLNEFVDDSEIKLRIAQMDNSTKIYLKRLDLAAADAQLQKELQAEFMTQQAKMQNDLTKKRMELISKVPEVPVFGMTRTFV